MATVFKSDQVTKIDSTPSQHVAVDELGGRVRRATFTKTLPGSGLAIGDTIDLVVLPAGARVQGGQFCWDQSQATATIAIGIAGTAGKYFAAAATASAAVFRMADTQAQNYNAKNTVSERLIATNAVAAWVAGSVLKGHVDYIVD